MRQFSELLGSTIKDRSFTIYSFAKQCGIERSLLQKYISGTRFPSDYQVVDKILAKLRLSPNEKRELELAYEKAYLGDNYEKFQIIENLVRELNEATEDRTTGKEDALSTKAASLYFKSTADSSPITDTVLNKHRDIQQALATIIGCKIQDPEAHVYIISQTENSEVEKIIRAILPLIQCHVHQLVCMDPKEENVVWNFELIKQIIPFFSSSMKYDVKYFYGNAKERVNTMSVMPNLIVTDDCAINYDYHLKNAVIYHSKEIVQMYHNIYTELESSSKDLIKTEKNSEEELAFYMTETPAEYALDYTPCPTYSFTLERLKELIIPANMKDESIFAAAANLISEWVKYRMSQGKPAVTYYFTKEGFDYFMRTGQNNGLFL